MHFFFLLSTDWGIAKKKKGEAHAQSLSLHPYNKALAKIKTKTLIYALSKKH